jgi:pimeloyl-ACP methyl ester carboxylesterase
MPDRAVSEMAKRRLCSLPVSPPHDSATNAVWGCYGREDAPPIILTHGWGANSTEWDHLKKELSDEFRLIVWDLPGLGQSTRPTNRDYSLENLSRHLEAVLALAGDQPAISWGTVSVE